MCRHGITFAGESSPEIMGIMLICTHRLLRHYKLPLNPLLPAILPYTARPSAAPHKAPGDFDFALPSSSLPNDTPLPVSLALEYLADALLEQNSNAEAGEVFSELSLQYDKMRSGYWEFRRRDCVEE